MANPSQQNTGLSGKEAIPAQDKHNLSRSISIATVIMMGSVFLSRITGMLREVTLANIGGTSGEMDAYVAAFLIPELLNHFLAGGFLSVTFIPIFQKYLVKNDHNAAWKVFSNLITIGTAAFAVFLPLSILLAPYFLSLTGLKGQDPQTFALTVRLTRIILPAQMFFYWGAFLMAVQYAHQRFFLPALSPLCYNLGIICGGIFLGPRFGIEGFAWGVLIGAFAGNVAVQLPGVLKIGMKYRFRFAPRDPEFGSYVKITIPLVAGLGMTFSNEIFFRYFASFLESGAAASANYALRTMMILVGVFGQASGVAFYPYLSKLAAEKAYAKMTELLNNMITRTALYLIPLSAVMIALAPQIILILYEHGRFTEESTRETAPVLTAYLFGAFAASVSILAARPFYAMQKTLLPMIISTAVSLISIPLYYIFSKLMGAAGLGFASSAAMTVQFLILYTIWGKRVGGLQTAPKEILKLTKIILTSAAGALLCFVISKQLESFIISDVKRVQAVFICICSSLPALAFVFFFYEILKLQKLRDTIDILLRRRKNR
ncbi:MAG: murein biosynthesis integral membrane protein MurJ [Chitinispirillales bacterium]|jgi:putative peptidoglycan lipid II flippase|nr:murein biosynthesis integral membrane protein MurJ [Chitinispirillales bacterium]